jgi:hypothetical protein
LTKTTAHEVGLTTSRPRIIKIFCWAGNVYTVKHSTRDIPGSHGDEHEQDAFWDAAPFSLVQTGRLFRQLTACITAIVLMRGGGGSKQNEVFCLFIQSVSELIQCV